MLFHLIQTYTFLLSIRNIFQWVSSFQEIKPAKNELHNIFSNISMYICIPWQRHKRLGRTNYLIYLFIWEPPRLFCVCRFYYSISSVACLRGRLLWNSYAASIYQILLLLLFMGHLLYIPNFVLKEIWNYRSPKVIIRTRTIHTQHPFLPTTTKNTELVVVVDISFVVVVAAVAGFFGKLVGKLNSCQLFGMSLGN